MNNAEEIPLKKRIGIKIVFGLLFVILLLQTIPFLRLDPDFDRISSQVFAYLYYVYVVLMYVGFSVLIYIEAVNLDEFHFDRFTLVTFILGSVIRPRSGLPGESVFFVLIGLSGALVIFTLVLKKPGVPITKIKWVIAGIVISSVAAVLLTLLEFSSQGNWGYVSNSRIGTVLGLIVRELPSAPIIEEILVRGFLWGYLKRMSISDNRIFWIQAAVFWLFHVGKVFTPFTFFITIPLFTILYSLLTLRSKQLFPSIISHLLVNILSIMLNWSAY